MCLGDFFSSPRTLGTVPIDEGRWKKEAWGCDPVRTGACPRPGPEMGEERWLGSLAPLPGVCLLPGEEQAEGLQETNVAL